MSRRYVHPGIALGIVAALGAGVVAACYDLPEPDCGFRCGPDRECPEEYTCSDDDNRCHRQGSDPALVCAEIVDAGADGAVDAVTP